MRKIDVVSEHDFAGMKLDVLITSYDEPFFDPLQIYQSLGFKSPGLSWKQIKDDLYRTMREYDRNWVSLPDAIRVCNSIPKKNSLARTLSNVLMQFNVHEKQKQDEDQLMVELKSAILKQHAATLTITSTPLSSPENLTHPINSSMSRPAQDRIKSKEDKDDIAAILTGEVTTSDSTD